MYGNSQDRLGEAQTRLQLGRAQLATGSYSEAKTEIEYALKAFREKSDPLGEGHADLQLGRLLRLQGFNAPAQARLENSLALFRRLKSKAGEAATHLETGKLYSSQGRQQAAEAAYNAALKLYRELDDRKGEADTRLELVWTLRFQNLERSRTEGRAALDLYRRLQSRLGEADARFALAVLDALEGAYPQAQSAYENSIAVYRALGTRHHEALALRSLARLHQLQGRYSDAHRLFGDALTLYQGLGDRNGEANARWSLGSWHRLQGAYGEAQKYFSAALRLYKETDNLQGIADVDQDLGLLSQLQGNYREAEKAFQEALELYQKSALQSGEAYARRNLGLLYGLQEDYGRADDELRAALKIFQARKSRIGEAYTRLELGTLLRRRGELREAEAEYRRAADLYREIGVRYGEAEAQKELGSLLRAQGKLDDAKRLLAASRQLAAPLQAGEILWEVSYELATIYERESSADEALSAYREAVRILEELASQFGEETARTQYLQAKNRLAVYDGLTELLLKLHKQDSGKGYDLEALAAQERKKGRIIAEALNTQSPAFRDPEAQKMAQALRGKAAEVAALGKRIMAEQDKPATPTKPRQIEALSRLHARTKAEFLRAREVFLKQYPQHLGRSFGQHTIDPKTLARHVEDLPQGILLAAYYPTDKSLWIFLVAKGQKFRSIEVPVDQPTLYAKVQRYRQILEKASTTEQRLHWSPDNTATFEREVAPLRRISSELYDILLKPIEPDLAQAAGLVIAPSGLLLYLPFHALTSSEPDGRLSFLAERITVSYLTQVELTDLLKAETLPALQLLALGNPDGTLRYAEREVRNVARLFPKSISLVREQATKAALFAQVEDAPFLHLATHAILGDKRPEQTYLVLANQERLTTAEIEGLSLPRRGLVALSACDTAVGEQTPGAALLTLASAFSQGGFPAILASLWKVNDAATSELMESFYQALPALGRAKALQQAQLSLLKNPQTAHPYYWAPFVLLGAR